jgi:hypothetical protein
MRTGRLKKKRRPDSSQPQTPGERELLALFREMAEPDRRLLLSTAEKLISSRPVSGNKVPWSFGHVARRFSGIEQVSPIPQAWDIAPLSRVICHVFPLASSPATNLLSRRRHLAVSM